ncbi:MAG: DUF4870 domain-containing protein [Bacilli bacterium]|nr:DUF4870 domain-containing protein [Bacilli bacterium]
MARSQDNTLAIIVWIVGLLGMSGFLSFLYPFGYLPLILPILFWILGKKFTRIHCQSYFNVLITAVVIYLLGLIIDKLFQLLRLNLSISVVYISLIYFVVMSIIGLIKAINGKRYDPELAIRIF